MKKSNTSSLKVAIVSAVFLIGLVTNPARADHYNNGIAPLATFVFLSSLFRHGHKQHHGHYQGYKRHGYNHGYKRHGYSQSYGAYSGGDHRRKAKGAHTRRDYRG